MEWPEIQKASKNILDFTYLLRAARVLIIILKEERLCCPVSACTIFDLSFKSSVLLLQELAYA